MFDYTILGAGAIGCVYGGLLAAKGHKVQLISRSPDLGRAVAEAGLRVDIGVRSITAPVVGCLADVAQDSRVVIVLTKTFQTEAAVGSVLHAFGGNTIWVTLQNGLGNAERLAHLTGSQRIMYGPVMMPARVVIPGHVWSMAAEPTKIGPVQSVDL